MSFTLWLIANYQTILTAGLAIVVALTHFIALFPLPQANVVVQALNKLTGNYGYATNQTDVSPTKPPQKDA